MGFELWTSPTPNGWKVTIMVEELTETGVTLPGLVVRTIDLSKGEHDEQFADLPVRPRILISKIEDDLLTSKPPLGHLLLSRLKSSLRFLGSGD